MIKHSTSSQSKTHLIFLSQIIMKHFLLFLLFYSNFSLGQNLVEYTAIGDTNPSSTAANMLATPIVSMVLLLLEAVLSMPVIGLQEDMIIPNIMKLH